MVMAIGKTVTATKPDQRNTATSGPNAVAAGRSSTYQSATPVRASREATTRSQSSRSGAADRRGVTRYQCPRISAATDVPSATADAAEESPVHHGPSDGLGRAPAAS